MTEADFPALYCAADAASNRAQAALLWTYRLNATLLVIAALIALLSARTPWLAIVSAALFLASLAVHMYANYEGLQKRWYQARALAESVKTATWRFLMAADPFADAAYSLEAFRALLFELLNENQGIGEHLAGDWSNHDQVTLTMKTIRDMTFPDKRTHYLRHRIDEQRNWYARRATENQEASRVNFVYLCLAYAAAVVMLMVRIARPDLLYLPIEACAVVASSIVGWKQLRRFDDLASAYGLTAHELGIIKVRFDAVMDASALGSFVSDAENAFSREHTQWAARRDH